MRGNWLAHVWSSAVGVLLFVLPVWLILAGSTQDSDMIARGELSLLPRLSGLGVYRQVLFGRRAPAAPPFRTC